MAYPVRIAYRKIDSGGTYFQVRNSNLALINEWKMSDNNYAIGEFTVDNSGNVFFAISGDSYLYKYSEAGNLIKAQTTAYKNRVTRLNSYGYLQLLRQSTYNNAYAISGFTKDDNLELIMTLYRSLDSNYAYYSFVFENEFIFYAGRFGVIEKWSIDNNEMLSSFSTNTTYCSGMVLIGNNIVFSDGNYKLYKVDKSGGTVSTIPIEFEHDENDLNPILGIRTGRLSDTTYVVAYRVRETPEDPYIWYLDIFDINGSLENVVEVGNVTLMSVGSYFDIEENLPSVETLTPYVKADPKELIFYGDLTNAINSKCYEIGFQYYNMNNPEYIRDLTSKARYWEDGEYSIIPSLAWFDIEDFFSVRTIAFNAFGVVYGDWIEFSFKPITLINIKADRQGHLAKIRLYGEITE